MLLCVNVFACFSLCVLKSIFFSIYIFLMHTGSCLETRPLAVSDTQAGLTGGLPTRRPINLLPLRRFYNNCPGIISSVRFVMLLGCCFSFIAFYLRKSQQE